MCVVTWDPAPFRALYPQFAAVGDPVLAALFAQATIYLDNTECSIVRDCGVRAALFNMLVAHLVQLGGYANSGDQPVGPTGVVGRISSATEGSVTVSAEWPGADAASAWYLQTAYGANYWQATAVFRTMHYRPGPPAVPARGYDTIGWRRRGFPWPR